MCKIGVAISPDRTGQFKGNTSEQAVASALTDAAPSTMVAFTARVVPSADNRAAKGKVGVGFLVDAATSPPKTLAAARN